MAAGLRAENQTHYWSQPEATSTKRAKQHQQELVFLRCHTGSSTRSNKALTLLWGDQYWMSDWSYLHAPDYERAESLYRQALANPDIDDRGDVQDRLDSLHDEQAHPETRARIRHMRLQHIQRRKHVD